MANLVRNGYFTSPNVNAGSFLYMTSSTMVDWSYSAGTLIGTPTSGFLANALPAGITRFFGFQGAINAGIYQNITFDVIGNGILSFWISKRIGYYSPAQSITVSLGSYSGTYTKTDTNWYYQTIPFSIGSNQLTQKLSISCSSTDLTTDQSIYISGISIAYTPVNYTLDLYLEWIPDEDVEKNY